MSRSEQKSIQFLLRMSPEQKNLLQTLSSKQNMTMSDYLLKEINHIQEKNQQWTMSSHKQ